MAKVIDGRRGGKVLVNDGFIYQKNQVRNDIIYWRCSSKACRAPLRTEFFDVNNPPDDIEIDNVGIHNHPAMDEAINRQVITNRMKQYPSAPIKRAYDATIADEERRASPTHPEDIPAFHNIESQLKRAKNANVPEIPADANDVVIEGAWGLTWRDRNFVIYQDNEWGILIFGTNRNLRLFRRAVTILADGTFRT